MTAVGLDRLVADRVASRIWARDLSVFAPRDTTDTRLAANFGTGLGWLDAAESFAPRVAELAAFGDTCWREQLNRVVLLGMGGSSLAAEAVRDVAPSQANAPHLAVLDTTDERTIREVTDGLSPPKTLFLVASKSGHTIEVTSLERHFWRSMTESLGATTGRHFVAITDAGSPLADLARDRQYRRTYENPPDIGGRYSALSFFGLVPAALLRQPLERLLRSAQTMAERCRDDSAENPGLALGAFLAKAANDGRDKLTVITTPAFRGLGAWIEQLVAESTGKDGRGLLPVVDEPVGRPEEYGNDRAFVVIAEPDATESNVATNLETAGHPVFALTPSSDELGGEFLRWEFATTVAAVALGVSPFDEPNVADAKRRTQLQLDLRRTRAAFRIDPPFERGQGYSRREHGREPQGAQMPGAGHYVAILDYLPREAARAGIIARLRAALRRRTGLATTYGIGPRYLHSTGQYHKGGPNTGLFLLLTAVDERVTAVPDAEYTFSALKLAQALGDFEALAAAGRHVVHYHFEDPSTDYSAALESVLRQYR